MLHTSTTRLILRPSSTEIPLTVLLGLGSSPRYHLGSLTATIPLLPRPDAPQAARQMRCTAVYSIDLPVPTSAAIPPTSRVPRVHLIAQNVSAMTPHTALGTTVWFHVEAAVALGAAAHAFSADSIRAPTDENCESSSS